MFLDQQSGADGPQALDTREMAEAYQAALSIVSLGDPTYAPTRDIRRGMLAAILRDAKVNGVSRSRLTLVAIAAAG